MHTQFSTSISHPHVQSQRTRVSCCRVLTLYTVRHNDPTLAQHQVCTLPYGDVHLNLRKYNCSPARPLDRWGFNTEILLTHLENDANVASVDVAVAGVLSKSSHFFTLKEEHRTTLKAFCSPTPAQWTAPLATIKVLEVEVETSCDKSDWSAWMW